MHDRTGAAIPVRTGGSRRAVVLGGLGAVAIAVIAIAAATGRTEPTVGESAAASTLAASVVAPTPTSVPETVAAATPNAPAVPPLATAAAVTTAAATSPVASPTTPATTTGDSPGTDPLDGTQPGLQAAFDAARVALADDGIELIVNSGYRTPEHQRELLAEAVVEYGSYEEASWWVFEPERSMHVQGLAVDVGSGPAADWLQQQGERYGICQTLEWEWWHFEWRQSWEDRGACPPAAATPADAPGVTAP